MEPECRNISKTILPAVRASVSEILDKEYRYRQKEIAEKIGVVQVAVSKYLNSRYSAEIGRLREHVLKNGLARGIVSKIVEGRPTEEISFEIDRVCGSIAAEGKEGLVSGAGSV